MKLIRLSIILALGGIMMAGCQSKKETKQPAKEKVENQANANVLPDFRMNSIGGSPISIKDEIAKNKITVLDFWASWCGPCLREAPNMVTMYNDYHAKGLGIVGISLDEDEASWKEAVGKLGMKWTQISDLQGWQNQAAQLFGVQSIPHTVVVDSKGTILAQGLRGEELSAFVASKFQ